MSTTTVIRVPASQPGQILRERAVCGKGVEREILPACKNPQALLRPGVSIWIGRHGGWVRLT